MMHHHLPGLSLLVAFAAAWPIPAVADVVQAGRYTLVITTPTGDQLDPFAAIVSVTFPRQQVATVGDAVVSLLSRSGWGLAQDRSSLPLSFPLPDVQRRFDTVSVRDVLLALGGSGYSPRFDPASRTVAYELRPEFVPVGAAAPAPAIAPWSDEPTTLLPEPASSSDGEARP